MKIRNKFGVLLLLLFGLCLLGGCGGSQPQAEEKQEEETQIVEESVDSVEEASVSYLTGLPVTEEIRNSRPLAVMFNNIKEGCPQAGIGQASIVYEAPVEGRTTRLMGIYDDYSDLEQVGSIRSSRDYFVYFAMEYDSIYAHFGQATPYVGELLNSDRVDNISGAVAGIDKPAPNTFYRSSERKAPHNVYLTSEGVKKDIERFQYRTQLRENYQPKFVFVGENQETLYANEADALVLYPGGKANDAANGFSRVQARFEYKEEDELYYRYQYGDAQIDELTGEQLAYANVVFQYCYGEIRDENDYLAFRCHGDDGFKVQVFTGGKVINGTWSRSADEVPASYVDENGNPIVLNPGKTWVCIIWDQYGQDVVVE